MRRSGPFLAAALGAAALSLAPAEARELVYGSWVGPKHSIMSDALPPLFDGVKRDTGGEITWKLVAGGQLTDARGTLSALRDGLIDAGFAIAVFTPNNLPATSLIFSTIIFGEDIVATNAATVETVLLHCPQCIEEHKKNNAVFLAGFSPTPYRLMCRTPVRNLADIKGKKVRAAGGGVALMKMAGAAAVSMSTAEATTALQKGTLDCVLGALTWLKTYGYQDVAKHVLDFPLGMVGPAGSMVVNRRTWTSLTDAQRAAHVKYLPLVVANGGLTAYYFRDLEVAKQAKAHGVTFEPPAKDLDWIVTERTKLQRKQNIARFGKLGVKNPEAILDAYAKTLAKWRGLSKEIGTDVDKYADAIKREIYDKLDLSKL